MILEEATLIIVGSQVAKASKKKINKLSAHKTAHLVSLMLEGSIYVNYMARGPSRV